MRTAFMIAAAWLLSLGAAGLWAYFHGRASGQQVCRASFEQARAQWIGKEQERQAQADAVISDLHRGALRMRADAAEHSRESIRYVSRHAQKIHTASGCLLAHDIVRRINADIDRANAAARAVR